MSYEEGVEIESKDKSVFIIQSAKDTVVVLKPLHKGKSIQITAAELVDDYKVVDKHVVVQHNYSDLPSPLMNNDIRIEQCKAIVREAITQAYLKWEPSLDLKITLQKSSKSVIVNTDYMKGHLILVPLSTSVVVAAKAPASGIDCGIVIPMAGGISRIYIMPKFEMPQEGATAGRQVEPFVAPFWCVKQNPDSAAVNMQFSTVEVTTSTTVDGCVINEVTLKLPMLTNSKNLVAGQEIFIKEGGGCSVVGKFSQATWSENPAEKRAPAKRRKKS